LFAANDTYVDYVHHVENAKQLKKVTAAEEV
jgi:hypothetical protein